MRDFFKVMFAGPAFFVSSWVLMLFAGAEAHNVGPPLRLHHLNGGNGRSVAERRPGDGRHCPGDPEPSELSQTRCLACARGRQQQALQCSSELWVAEDETSSF
jgi:hypothetical protein